MDGVDLHHGFIRNPKRSMNSWLCGAVMWGWSAASAGEQPTGLLNAPPAAAQSDIGL